MLNAAYNNRAPSCSFNIIPQPKIQSKRSPSFLAIKSLPGRPLVVQTRFVTGTTLPDGYNLLANGLERGYDINTNQICDKYHRESLSYVLY